MCDVLSLNQEMRRIIMKKIDEADAKRKVPQIAGLGPSPLASSRKTVLTPELEQTLLGGDDASCVCFSLVVLWCDAFLFTSPLKE